MTDIEKKELLKMYNDLNKDTLEKLGIFKEAKQAYEEKKLLEERKKRAVDEAMNLIKEGKEILKDLGLELRISRTRTKIVNKNGRSYRSKTRKNYQNNSIGKPRAISIKGQKIETYYAKDILVETANYLFDNNYLDSSNIPIRTGGRKRYIVNKIDKHRDGKMFLAPRKLNCGFFIETNLSANMVYKHAQKLMKIAGFKKDDIQLLD